MAYYMIDFENVKSRGMEGIEFLTEEDVVCIFYSDNADSMTFDLHRKLNETRAKIVYHKVAVGTKNALDFQLATYLGYLICEQQKDGFYPNYYIVTKDNGFTSLMVYWKAEGVPVRIIRSLMWGKNQEPAKEDNQAVQEPAKEDNQAVQETIQEDIPSGQKTTETEFEIWENTVPDTPDTIESAKEAHSETAEETEIEPEPKSNPQKKTPEKRKNSRKNTEKKTDQNATVVKKKTEKDVITISKQEEEETLDELTRAVEAVLQEKEIVPRVVKFIRQYKTKQGINNALNKEFKDSRRTSEIYSAIKPLIADKKGK